MGSVLSLVHTTAQSEPGIPKLTRRSPVLQTGTSQVPDLPCFHLMSCASFHPCQVNFLSRTQRRSHFLTQKTPECSLTNRPSMMTVGYWVQIQNCFSGCRLKIEPASGGRTPPLSLGGHPQKLTFAGLYTARVGRSAGPASRVACEDYSIVLLGWNFDLQKLHVHNVSLMMVLFIACIESKMMKVCDLSDGNGILPSCPQGCWDAEDGRAAPVVVPRRRRIVSTRSFLITQHWEARWQLLQES